MKKIALIAFKVMLSGTVLVGLTVSMVRGKAEYTKKEGKPCVTCHVKSGAKELNDVGKCYEKSKSLKDCTDKSAK